MIFNSQLQYMPKKTITNVRKSCDICKSMGNIFCFLTFRTGGGYGAAEVRGYWLKIKSYGFLVGYEMGMRRTRDGYEGKKNRNEGFEHVF